MSKKLILLLALAVTVSAQSTKPKSAPAPAASATSAAAANETIALKGGKLLTITHGVIENGVVVMQNAARA